MLKKYLFPFTIIFFINFFVSSLSAADSNNKIIYLISGPRALSTVFLRMMESREDFIIFNEPTIPVYDKVHYIELTKDWFREDANETFDDVKSNLFEAQKKSNVFVKDMSFSSCDYICGDEEFLKDSSIHFVFLVRDPHHSSISFYKKVNCIVPGMSDLIGLKKLYDEYIAVKELNPNPVKIIFTEQVYESPKEMMKKFCDELNIAYLERAFTWKKNDHTFQGHNIWNEQKVGDHIHHWHGKAIQSTKLGKPSSYAVDSAGNPAFSEILNKGDRNEMVKVYKENLVYYLKFKEAKEDHLLRQL